MLCVQEYSHKLSAANFLYVFESNLSKVLHVLVDPYKVAYVVFYYVMLLALAVCNVPFMVIELPLYNLLLSTYLLTKNKLTVK